MLPERFAAHLRTSCATAGAQAVLRLVPLHTPHRNCSCSCSSDCALRSWNLERQGPLSTSATDTVVSIYCR